MMHLNETIRINQTFSIYLEASDNGDLLCVAPFASEQSIAVFISSLAAAPTYLGAIIKSAYQPEWGATNDAPHGNGLTVFDHYATLFDLNPDRIVRCLNDRRCMIP